jgi:Zn-finger nucleic acid-binding protein
MECPACHHTLSPVEAGGVTVDVCTDGCGGLWFSWMELQRFDEPKDAGDILLGFTPQPGVTVDPGPLHCPQCADKIQLKRHFFSVKRDVTVDECPECGGYWLDPGELRSIRADFGTHDERRAAAGALIQETFGDQLAAEHAETQEHLERAHKVANMLRFICPSYYIPGQQQWGAF